MKRPPHSTVSFMVEHLSFSTCDLDEAVAIMDKKSEDGWRLAGYSSVPTTNTHFRHFFIMTRKVQQKDNKS